MRSYIAIDLKSFYASVECVERGLDPLTTNLVYKGLVEALGVDIEPIYGPDRAGDIKHSNADISKAKALLGYDPDWSFERGIKAAIEWYRNNL